MAVGGKRNPNARCSASYQPAPRPSSIRPFEMWSTVLTMLARTDGWRKVAGETMVPSRMRSVRAARADMMAQASMALAPGPFIDR